MSRDIEPAPRQLRVLAVSMAAPNVPGGGGATRAYHVLSALCEIADVTLIVPSAIAGQGAVSADIAGRCVRVIEPVWPTKAAPSVRNSRVGSWLRLAGVLTRPWQNNWSEFFGYYLQHGMPNLQMATPSRGLGRLLRLWWKWLARYANLPPAQALFLVNSWGECERVVQSLVQTEQFDVLWCEDSLSYSLAEKLHHRYPGWDLMSDSYNIEFKLRERLRDSATHEAAADYWDSQISCCRRLEYKIYSKAAVTFVCSDADADAGKLFCPQGNFVVIGNGVDTSYFRRCGLAEEHRQPLLLFTGGFGYEPNADAVVHFVSRILPAVRLAVPKCRFVFAGRAAGGLFQKLQLADPLVTAIDSPEDMRPVFESATVFVVPLLSGGGTRLKILEAMAMQLPIVSTAIGAEGIDCNPGEHLLVAGSDEEFAGAVVELLRDEKRRRTMGEAARTWVCANMDWKIHREKLKSAMLEYTRSHESARKSSG